MGEEERAEDLLAEVPCRVPLRWLTASHCVCDAAAEEGVNDAAWPLSQTASPESAVRAEVASLQTM